MKPALHLRSDEQGAAAIEMAFALPVFVLMVWMLMQMALVYRAVSGIQQALGEGARFATLCIDPTAAGCDAPTPQEIQDKINEAVYGIGPGTFVVSNPVSGSSGTSDYYDLTVTYTQPTDMLLFPGPTISVAARSESGSRPPSSVALFPQKMRRSPA